MGLSVQLRSLNAQKYQSHPLHDPQRQWPETNCYVDLWIEALHGLGYDPYAALPFCVATDFEGDQWTFFKFPLEDLYSLYGIEVQEMAVWKPLEFHVQQHLQRHRLCIVEMDAFYLPDVKGTSYQTEHVKTSIAIQSIDVENKRLGYFHNAGYFELSGNDFDGVFRKTPELQSNRNILPPYVEMAKLNDGLALQGDALTQASMELLKKWVRRVPAQNPFLAFQTRFGEDLNWLQQQPLGTFHLYAFNSLRQIGACYELFASYLEWLGNRGQPEELAAVPHFQNIASTAKASMFKLARAVNSKKSADFSQTFSSFSSDWEKGVGLLRA